MKNLVIKMKLSEGKRLSRKGMHGEAVDSFVNAAKIFDRDHKAHYYLGLEMIALGRPERALDNLDISLSRNPKFTKALFWRCFVLIILGRDGDTGECLAKSDLGLEGHHYIYQFKAIKKKGYTLSS